MAVGSGYSVNVGAGEADGATKTDVNTPISADRTARTLMGKSLRTKRLVIP